MIDKMTQYSFSVKPVLNKKLLVIKLNNQTFAMI